jgi:hypothetical protein
VAQELTEDIRGVSPNAADDVPRKRGVGVLMDKSGSVIHLYGPGTRVIEAEQFITAQLLSLEGEQARDLTLSPEAAAYLRRVGEDRWLAKTQEECGATSCSVAGGIMSVKGPLAAIEKVERMVSWLHREAAAGKAETWAASDAAGRECPICMGVVDKGDLYVVEPCGHVYHKECIENTVSNAVSSLNFPVLCCSPDAPGGCCNAAITLEDVKACVKDGQGYSQVLEKAFTSFINSNADVWTRCFTEGCNQVR